MVRVRVRVRVWILVWVLVEYTFEIHIVNLMFCTLQ